MFIPDVKDLVANGRRVAFVRYQSNQLWYVCEGGFEFPVPVDDTGDGVFLREDKALVFMRWIRKHVQFLRDATSAQNFAAKSPFEQP